MSRPVSRKGSAKAAKPKKKTPKQQIAELTEQNETLTKELESIKDEASQMRDKIDIVTRKLITNVKKKEFGLTDETDPHSINNTTLLDIIDNLVVKKQIYEVSVENRVDDLESKLTGMTMDLAKMKTKTTAYEYGLEDLGKSDNVGEMKDRIYQLQLIAGREYHTFSANDSDVKPEVIMNGYHGSKPNSTTKQSLQNAHLLNLTKPSKKSLGQTLVKNMHKDLKMFIIQELSQEKASGGDWRRFGERTGIPEETIADWVSQKLQYPMGRVLDTWGVDPSATVRILHRHLLSPQMRCTLVAKWVADYYDVD